MSYKLFGLLVAFLSMAIGTIIGVMLPADIALQSTLYFAVLVVLVALFILAVSLTIEDILVGLKHNLY